MDDPSGLGEPSWRRVTALAWPIILANLAVPLLGLADTAVIGNLGDASALAAIAIATQVFSFLYWGLGFLRMGTTGFAAQARGRSDVAEQQLVLLRAVLLGGLLGAILVLAQRPVETAALLAFPSTGDTHAMVSAYLRIRIWGAPATLGGFAVLGWLIGMQETRVVMALQVLMNALNIGLDVLFVVGFGWGVRGVAAGTLISEYVAFAAGSAAVLLVLRRRSAGDGARRPLAAILSPAAALRMLAVNRDIFIRTVLLIGAFAWFTRQGARAGEVVLAANHVLLQFLTFSSFFLDGFAFAAEALVGEAVGARDRCRLVRTMRRSTILAAATAVVAAVVFAVAGPAVIRALTNVDAVRTAARTFLPYAVLHPVVGVWCFQLDGFFIGATRGADMRNAMVASFVVYLGAWWLLWPVLGNHGLWLAFLLFFAVRGLTLGLRRSALLEDAAPPRR